MKIASSIRNTLWFFYPSVALCFISILFSIKGYLNYFSFYQLQRDITVIYYFLLLPNIPFFIASYLLYLFLEKGLNKIVSVVISTIMVVILWFPVFKLSSLFFDIGDIGFGGILLGAIAILSHFIFLLRACYIAWHKPVEEVQNDINAISSTNKSNKNLNNVIFGFVILVLILLVLLGYFYFL